MKGINWIFALAVSIGAHVIVVAALIATRGEKTPPPEPESIPPVLQTGNREEANGERAAGNLLRQGYGGRDGAEANGERAAGNGAEANGERVTSYAKATEVETGNGEEGNGERTIEKALLEPGVELYTVKSGDNLTAISKMCGATFTELAAMNGTTVKKLANLRVGQVIKVKAKK